MNWNDELCGVKVTPESAVADGWIIQMPGGQWRIFGKRPSPEGIIDKYKVERGQIVNDGMDLEDRSIWYHKLGKVEDCKPIFPPKGWAGKTDWELFCELWPGPLDAVLATGDGWIVSMERAARPPVPLLAAGHIEYGETEYTNSATLEPAVIPDTAALILALQNAQVLARRLA